MAERSRRTFGPVVLGGLAGAGLAALAGSEVWATADACAGGAGPLGAGAGESPATAAVALAVLASWGALLVTRGRVRRALSFLTALLSVGLVVTVVAGARAAGAGLREAYADVGVTCTDTGLTGWFWLAAVAAPLAFVAALLAVRLVPTWPEMGRRYDAPAGAPVEEKAPEERDGLDLWKAINEGRDPTA